MRQPAEIQLFVAAAIFQRLGRACRGRARVYAGGCCCANDAPVARCCGALSCCVWRRCAAAAAALPALGYAWGSMLPCSMSVLASRPSPLPYLAAGISWWHARSAPACSALARGLRRSCHLSSPKTPLPPFRLLSAPAGRGYSRRAAFLHGSCCGALAVYDGSTRGVPSRACLKLARLAGFMLCYAYPCPPTRPISGGSRESLC